MGETSESIRKRVQAAREIQNKHFGELTNIVCNAGMRIAQVSKFCHLHDEGQSLMRGQ